jgi:hypothetical protein
MQNSLYLARFFEAGLSAEVVAGGRTKAEASAYFAVRFIALSLYVVFHLIFFLGMFHLTIEIL